MRQEFVSLDLQSRETCESAAWEPALFDAREESDTYSIVGSGKSITGAYFGEGVTVVGLGQPPELTELNLQENQLSVSCAATVAQVQSHLVSKGYMLTGVPSYPGVTIGGCIAGNVHGQNHFREGCFCESLIRFTLIHPDLGLVSVDRESYPELFNLTVGGFGLTGLIINATLKIEAIKSSFLDVSLVKFSSIEDAYEKLVSKNNAGRYFHSWVDLTTLSPNPGRGFFYKADFSLTPFEAIREISSVGSEKNHLRFKLPIFSKTTVSALNRVYYQKNLMFPKKTQALVDFVFPSARRLWYFSMFGSKGIIEHQVLIPHERVPQYTNSLVNILKEKNPFVSLSHVKHFSGRRKLLNFNGSGLCLALHFRAGVTEFETLALIDKLNCDCNCITNILKDSRVPRWAIKEQYSEYDEFVTRLHKFDPRRLFRNSLSQRLIDLD